MNEQHNGQLCFASMKPLTISFPLYTNGMSRKPQQTAWKATVSIPTEHRVDIDNR